MKSATNGSEYQRIQAPKIIGSRCVGENGRIVTKYLIDATRELGRGNCYWLSSFNGPSNKQVQK